MKKITLIFFLFLHICVCFGQEIASFDYLANSGCSGTIASDVNLTTTGICRGSGIVPNSGTTYNSRDWSTAGLDSDDYLEWSITPASGYHIDLSSMHISYDRSGTGPSIMEIQVNSGSGFTTVFIDTSVNSLGEDLIGLDLSSITGVANTITFRVYAYNASSSAGTFDIEELPGIGGANKGIIINGVVSSGCTNTTTYTAGSWDNGTPTAGINAIVNDDYNTGVSGSFTACSLVVNAGYSLNVTDNTYVEIINDVAVDGDITVETHGAFVQVDDASNFIVNAGGSSSVRKMTSTLTNWYDYTYWSSPVAGLTVSSSPLVFSSRLYWFNANNYLDILDEFGNTGVYNTGSDDIDDNGDDWQHLSGSSNLDPGVGYAATHSKVGFTSGLQYNYTFNGAFNNGAITTSIESNPANLGGHWNLIGNPYPCALDFDAFYAVNSGVIDGAAYLWSQSTPPSETAQGNQAYNFSGMDYVVISAIGSVSTSPGIIGNFIPSGQGFFIAGINPGTITFNNSMRIADNTSNSQFFKQQNTKKSKNNANKFWVNLTTNNGVFNQVLIGYVEKATDGKDRMAYDAPRNVSGGFSAIIYSLIDEDDTFRKYAIQGKSTSSLNTDEVVKLGFSTKINASTNYTLSMPRFEGEFLKSNSVYIKDNLLDTIHNLSESDYTFTSSTGEFNDRFEIIFNSDATLSTDNISEAEKALKIIALDDDNVQFSMPNKKITSVKVFDLLGRELYSFKGNSNSETYKISSVKNAVYIAKVALENGVIINKKAVKQ